MAEVWRHIFSALNEAQSAMENAGALHARDFASPEDFAKAKQQMQADYAAITAMRSRALGVFIVWDGVKKPGR